MSETENKDVENETKKKGSALGLIVIVIALLAVIFGLSAYKNQSLESSSDVNKDEFVKEIAKEDQDAVQSPETAKVDTDQAESTEEEQEEATASADSSETSEFDFDAAATPRILGNPEAPVKISEHSSFTCGGCAGFHSDNFKKIKRDFIDTGKAYIVFDDFPRNRYDLSIGAVARCVDEDAYFDFIQLLFETQKTWLNDDYLKHVKQNALLSGASEEDLAHCIGNEALYKVLADRQKNAMDTHKVDRTPTLIINDTVNINGLMPYAQIKAAIEEQLKMKESATKDAPSSENEVSE